MQVRRSLFLFALVAATTLPLRAQDLRGRITGSVVDPDGRAVHGAQVVAAEATTGTRIETKTNTAGRFAVGFLPVGEYEVAIEKLGFKRVVREGIRLGADDEVGLQFELEIGAVEESVTVVAERDRLETETASRGASVSQQAIARLPNNGRNIYQLVWAAPGVVKASTYWGSMENFAVGNASSSMMNGGIEGENETLMDGVTNTQPNRDVNYQPPIEAVEEVKTLTSVYDASYGRYGGGVVALTTRSGSNSFHGTLHETNKSAALAANPWVLNSLGEAKPHFVNNTFGATVGGPIRRNRLFYMASYEGLRQRSSDDDSTFTAPADLRSGDFSAHQRSIYDPLTTRREGDLELRDPFPGNRIPQTRVDPVAAAALAFTPLPNLPGRAFPEDNYALFGSEKVDYDQYLFKADYNLNDSNRVYFSNGKLYFTERDANLFGQDTPADPNRKNPLRRNFERWVADWTSTLGTSAVLNARVGLGRHVETRGNPPAAGFDPRDLGFADALVSQFGFLQFPLFEIDGPYTQIGSRQVFLREAADSWSGQIGWNQTIRTHSIQAGAEVRVYNENLRIPGNASGVYRFDRRFTQADPGRGDARSGDELAGFLLGFPAGGAVDGNIDPALQGRYTALFFQDQWKVSARLTLSLGLRWDYERPYTERFNRMLGGFAFETPSPIDPLVPELDLRGGLLFADQPGFRAAADPDRNNIQPRIGVAYQAGRNWVLRGGYGLYYLGLTGGQPTTGFSATTPLIGSVDGRTPRVSLSNAFPEGLLQPIGSSLGLSSRLGQGVTIVDRKRVVPYSRQYSAGVQRKLPWGFLAEASYSGNEIRRYPVSGVVNQLPEGALDLPNSFLNELVDNPLEGLIPNNASLNGSLVTRSRLMLPFPHFAGIRMDGVSIGRSSYHSLQSRVKRSFASGFSLDAAFTISKTLEQLNLRNPPDFKFASPDQSRLEKRLAEFDVPKKFAALFTYDLPFGRGRAFGANWPRPWRSLASGWGFQGQLTLQSGFPVAFPNAPNLEARSAKLPGGDLELRRAFDTSLFPSETPNVLRRDWPTRFPDVRLQPLQNLDLGIARSIRLSERIRLDLRAEMLNTANRPWFSRLHRQGADVTREQFGWFEQEEQNQNRQVALVAKLTW